MRFNSGPCSEGDQSKLDKIWQYLKVRLLAANGEGKMRRRRPS